MDTHVIDLPHVTTAPLRTPGERSHGDGFVAEGHIGTPGTIADPAPGLSAHPSDRLDEREAASPLSSATRRRRRPVLLATAAVVMVAAVGGGFLISPYNTIYPIDTARLQVQGRQMAASVGRQASDLVAPRPNMVAPAAKIAATQAPQAPAPTRAAAAATPTQKEQQAEILSLRSGARSGEPTVQTIGETGHVEPAPAPVTRPAAAPARTVQRAPRSGDGIRILEPGMAMPPQAQAADAGSPAVERGTPAAPQAQQAPASPAPLPPTPAPIAQVDAVQPLTAQVTAPQAGQADPRPPRPVEKPVDPVAVVAALQAAPMTPPEQIQVLNEVARLAIVVRDIRAENAALKARVESTADRFDQAVADFTRRLALAEAHGALNAAMGADPALAAPFPQRGASQPDQVVALPAGSRTLPGGGTRVVATGAVVSAGATPAAAVRYRVTAASPGLAMLALLDRSGGEGAQIQVTTGDQVPGYGRVTAIQQRGASWIVQTDKGPDKGVIQ